MHIVQNPGIPLADSNLKLWVTLELFNEIAGFLNSALATKLFKAKKDRYIGYAGSLTPNVSRTYVWDTFPTHRCHFNVVKTIMKIVCILCT